MLHLVYLLMHFLISSEIHHCCNYFDEMEKKLTAGSDDLGEDFYGDQGYNSDEIDAEGYEGLDGIVGGDSYDGSDIY